MPKHVRHDMRNIIHIKTILLLKISICNGQCSTNENELSPWIYYRVSCYEQCYNGNNKFISGSPAKNNVYKRERCRNTRLTGRAGVRHDMRNINPYQNHPRLFQLKNLILLQKCFVFAIITCRSISSFLSRKVFCHKVIFRFYKFLRLAR